MSVPSASADAGKPPAAQPQAAPAVAPAGNLSGEVLETMNAGGYTYMLVKTSAGEEWVAVRETKVAKGETVSISAQMTAEKFESNTLKRTFDRIVFGELAGAAPSASGAMPPSMMSSSAQMPPNHPAPAGGAMGTPKDHMTAKAVVGDVRVDRAEGGRTVAEIWSGKAALGDKPVIVRGKVVKYLPGIMGKNWIHIRDGSGSDEKGDNDLTVTTNESAAVGDVVVIKGLVRVDKDFGAGYLYPVIVEDAKISK